jgi:DNA-binding HxlR family transcriptional regulator
VRLAGPKIYSRLRCNLICVLEISMLATIGQFLSARLLRFYNLASRLLSGEAMGEDSNWKSRSLQSRDAVELLPDKWRITLLHLLTPGAQRAKALQQAITKISPKVLTQTLRGMERDGLISRKVYASFPPGVEYQLTDMGTSVIEPLRTLCHWAQAHAEERDRARREFDARKGSS